MSHLKAISDIGDASFGEDLALTLIHERLLLAVELVGMQQTTGAANRCPLGSVICICSPALTLFWCKICVNYM